MKKIFSLSLMAVALLISGNAKAGFVEQWNAAVQNGGTVTLTDDVENPGVLTLGTGKEVTLNLNGYDIAMGTGYFVINHGTLNLTGEGTISFEFAKKPYYGIDVTGSTEPTAENYSVLSVGEDVQVVCEGTKGYAIRVADNSEKSYGVVIDVYGLVHGIYGGITINGQVKATTGNVPVVNIYPSATVEAGGYIGGAGIYAAGYGIWNIQGTVQGDMGIYTKGGKINLDGAAVYGTGEYKQPEVNNDGFDGGGTAIVFDANENYAGKIEFTSEGNSTVSSTNGYAIQECITNSSSTEMISINIADGDYNGGLGGIVTTDEVKSALSGTNENFQINGGTFNNNDMTDYLDLTKVETIEVDGKQVVVTKDASITEREVVAGNFGTICYGFNSTNYAGAIFFQIDEADETGLTLVEVPTLQAGYPYIFLATASKIVLEQGTEENTTPQTVNHLVGSYTEAGIAEGTYIIKNNLMTPCGTGCKVGANRAYIDLGSAGAPVQARRVGGKKATLTADATTALPETAINAKVLKSIANGKFMIVKDGVKFNAAGQKIE